MSAQEESNIGALIDRRQPITVLVPGKPLSQGSMVPMLNRHTGKPFLKHGNPNLLSWRDAIMFVVQRAIAERADASSWLADRDIPWHVKMAFVFSRPRSHTTGRGSLTLRAPREQTQVPDIDKVERAVLDALTGTCWVDDSQVTGIEKTKLWGPRPGLVLSLRPHVTFDDTIELSSIQHKGLLLSIPR